MTPLAIDPGHPFPHLVNRALCLVVSLRPTEPSLLPSAALAVIHIPAQVIPRFIRLPGGPGEYNFMLLEDVIRLNLSRLYHGLRDPLGPRDPGDARRRRAAGRAAGPPATS